MARPLVQESPAQVLVVACPSSPSFRGGIVHRKLCYEISTLRRIRWFPLRKAGDVVCSYYVLKATRPSVWEARLAGSALLRRCGFMVAET